MTNGIYLLDRSAFDKIYGAPERQEIERLLGHAPVQHDAKQILADPASLRDVEVVLGGWGTPRFDRRLLEAAPKLRAILYGAGSIRGVVSDEMWDRGIVISSAAPANALPVADYTLGAILMSLKRVWHYVMQQRLTGRVQRPTPTPGTYGSTVGMISLGVIARRVVELLRPLDLKVIAYDPFFSEADAASLGVERVLLDEVFARSDVVSLHTPNLPETRGMIRGEHFLRMKQYATFINTARGAVVREGEMIEVLRERPDLTAVLDVTDPEPPPPNSPLLALANVVLTPHIAGSVDAECRRMGGYMVEELRRYLAGEPLKWGVTRERAAILA